MKVPAHYHDIFYKTTGIDFEKVIKWALPKAWDAIVEDKSSGTRVSTDISIKEFMHFRQSSIFRTDVIIHRRGYDSWKGSPYFKHRWCIEMGSRINGPDGEDLISFIYLDEEYLEEMINKFKLEKL